MAFFPSVLNHSPACSRLGALDSPGYMGHGPDPDIQELLDPAWDVKAAEVATAVRGGGFSIGKGSGSGSGKGSKSAGAAASET